MSAQGQGGGRLGDWRAGLEEKRHVSRADLRARLRSVQMCGEKWVLVFVGKI